MKNYHFKNKQRTNIPSGPASTILSTLDIQGTAGQITDVNIKMDIEHTWVADLIIKLTDPSGVSCVLVRKRGGSGNDFKETVFDDGSNSPISNANPPFEGTFSPEESLSIFNNSSVNGTWTLEISDTAAQDGGALNEWELEIVTDEETENTGPFLFHNQTPKNISDGGPNTIESQIKVQGLDNITIDSVRITADIEHTYDSDLKLKIKSPDGTEVVLADKEGGSGNNFQNTTFDDDSTVKITAGSPPFNGTYQPEGRLSDFQGIAPNGTWTLIIEDLASADGGALKSWTLSIKSDSTPVAARPFQVIVRFLGGLSQSQKAIFQDAADRWSEVITGNLPSIQTDIGIVDDVVIDAEAVNIDGVGQILGQAGPTKLRPGSLLPARGIMQFDIADLQKLEDDGELLDVIIHEMGHVLGIGTLWAPLSLIQGSGTNNPVFTGSNAKKEYADLKNFPNPINVPVANTGGDGTREGHWRESVFDSELMTGYDDPGRNALSRLTIASLQDIGYQVDYNKADTYILPFGLLSLSTVAAKKKHQCMIKVPEFEILPEENLIT